MIVLSLLVLAGFLHVGDARDCARFPLMDGPHCSKHPGVVIPQPAPVLP